jgi:hypothetical protein
VVDAEPYDDTIVFHLSSNKDLKTDGWIDASPCEPWSGLIGEPFGWGWITINQQDALDGILLSFRGITPLADLERDRVLNSGEHHSPGF